MLHEVKDIANGRYRLGEPLGEGGMAIVYQAHDELLQVDRAVKLLAPALCHREKIRQRFMAEARTMARLRHPNIVPVFDVGEDDGVPYIVMALIPGGNLAERVQAEGGLSCVESLAMIKGVLAGLSVVHDQGVVHRDIKPQNVLLDLDGAPLLTDFGIAQTDFDERNLTRTGAVMGTMAYMPPEQRQSAKSVTASSDIYAVGAMLYALLTNKLPFDLYAKENQDRLLGDIPEPVREVIARACAYSTADRYATAADMQDALHSAQAQLTGGERLSATTAAGMGPQDNTFLVLPEAPRTNLMSTVDGFVGRERELQHLHELLLQERRRLVTLIGPGGIGKTRLARHFGLAQIDAYASGVFFLDVASCRTVEGICSVAAAALDLPLDRADPVNHLGHALKERGGVLLIIDNLEQAIGAGVELMSKWLQMAPGLQVLATSRERLQVAGESVVLVQALQVSDAVRLFEARAHSVGAVTAAHDAQDIRHIVECLDGLPLALEMAAARLDILSASELLERLEPDSLQPTVSRAGLLAGGGAGTQARHQTLRSTFEWSWELMEPWERDTLTQCSVFVGSFSVSLAEQVVDLSRHQGAPMLVDVIRALVRKSMIQVVEPVPKVRRLSLLRSVSIFAAEHFSETERRQARQRHLDGLQGAGCGASADQSIMSLHMGRVEALELDNLIAAMRFGLESSQLDEAYHCMLQVCAIAHAVGPAQIGVQVTQAMQQSIPDDHPLRSLVMLEHAHFLKQVGQSVDARRCIEHILGHKVHPLSPLHEGQALSLLGRLSHDGGERERAQELLTRAVSLLRETQSPIHCVPALRALGLLHRDMQPAMARTLYEEALEISTAEKQRFLQASTHLDIGYLDHESGNLAVAEYHYKIGMSMATESGHRAVMIRGSRAQGWIWMERGEAGRARRHFEHALGLARTGGFKSEVAAMLGTMGQVLSMEGCHAEASEALEEAVALFVSMGAQRHEGVARGSLAQVFISLGLQEAAQRELRLACNLLKGNHRVGFCVYRANLAALMSIHGDVAEASQMAESALVEIRELNSKDNFCHVLANVAQVRFQQGDEAGSRQALDEAARMFSELQMAENSPVGQSISAAREATGYHG